MDQLSQWDWQEIARDRFGWMAERAENTVVLLGKSDLTDLVYVELQSCPLPANVTREYEDRGLRVIGAAGIIDGDQHMVTEKWLSIEGIVAVTKAFDHYWQVLERQQKGDSVDWLRSLWALPDTRNA